MRGFTTALLALLAVGTALPSGAGAQELPQTGDRLFLTSLGTVQELPLPYGPASVRAQLDFSPVGVVATTDGLLYAVERRSNDENPFWLHRVEDTGTTEIGDLPVGVLEDYLDITAGPDGTIFLHIRSLHPLIPVTVSLLRQLDPGLPPFPAIVHEVFPSRDLSAIAPSPTGLWGITEERLVEVDLENGWLIETGVEFDSGFLTFAAASDSTGSLWLAQELPVTSPPTFRLARLDPVTHSLKDSRIDVSFGPMGLAIARGCIPDETHRCLLGGRFRAEVRWRDFEGNEGDGVVAPRGSADSALFWFFEPANWEVLVKMVDGCEANGHFWVFAAGTTDVEFELTITDLVSGEVFEASNPLGQASAAVTDTTAFATCGGTP